MTNLKQLCEDKYDGRKVAVYSEEVERPPKITLTPEGVAGLFLMSHCKGADKDSVDALVEIFKLYWEEGVKSGSKAND